MSKDHRFLFAVEAGGNEISVLAGEGEKLIPVDRVPSGGTFPVSLTVHKNLLYVLNREDSTLGHSTVTGFTVSADGKLCALSGCHPRTRARHPRNRRDLTATLRPSPG